jgi:6-pyruvoyltetrahydropterin/6-carboxytetrahydropterin synthase
MFELMVESTFDSAHNLRRYEGACESLHGHTYKVQVFYRGAELGALGMLVDFKQLKSSLCEVTSELDHKYLNEQTPFTVDNPTAENVARYIFRELRSSIGEGICRVTVWETATSAASYWEED